MIKNISYIFYVECLLLLRKSREWLYPFTFFIVVLSLFPFAFTPDPLFLQKYIPGCIWIAVCFASLLSTENIFYAELEEGHLEQLLLSNISFPMIVITKLSAHWLITQGVFIVLIPLLALIFNLSWPTTIALMCGLLLGTPILILLGAFGVSLTLGLRQQGVLLSLLILPLIIPILIFGVNMATEAAAGFSILGPCAFLAGICVFAILLLPLAISVALKISLDQ